MADLLSIHDDIKLYTTSDKFYLEPTIHPTEILVIDRVTGEASVKDIGSVKIPIPANAYRPVCGFLGSIKLISGLYLVVAKYRILVGKLNGHEIYQLAGTDIIPYARSNTHLTSKQIEDNATYERMLRAALDTVGIYFSYSYDLTHCLQRLHSVTPDFHRMSIANRADPRFLWNGFLLRDYSHQQFSRFTLPIIQGFVSINNVTVNGHSLTWSLVSRRCVDRAGTRFFMRGVDAQGNVANFVETEQIIERGGEKSSFVQTRGSIPLFWSQYPDIKYKPAMQLSHEDHVAAYTKHLRDQQQRYGNQVLVNLIDQHGKEEALERGFRAAVAAAALPGVRYEPFDFHAECRSMRYYRLNVLIDRIKLEQAEFGYFLSRGGTVLLRQNGVFRTNCVDCLDRTNVVQSLLARLQLTAALRILAVTNSDDEKHAEFDNLFNNDSIDLFLGKYVVTDGEGNTLPCPLRRDRDWKYITFPSVLLVAMSMFCASATLPQRYTSEVLLYLMFWGAAVTATLTFIFRHGKEFVDWPRLDAGGLAAARALPPPQSL
ncbi:phosphatidylinositol-3-phosphatase SAC1 isoform X2 [Spodoptera frugiperda]|uniref:Phosphatidylinositol-3-phosphatase SAC1 n=1 Tax=Spodoptera frugiperda TaxID=7108 RepID=A0A9R0DSB5_SPOFR|nr:phosphatidylinositol-3-phosphatase SAC1 isoform X2 [Spodoptera frugiperda]